MSPDTLVADSFLVDHGRVLRLDAHAERFARAAAELGFSSDRAARSLVELARRVPTTGVWFPRIDLLADHTLETQVRPASERGGAVRLLTAAHDPRSRPGVKGPDLVAGATLREQARALGADEAVITTDGWVCDGALSALVWWRGDALHLPDPALTRVPSVTAGWLADRVAADGGTVSWVRARPDDLAGAEVWVLSALHGPRAVVEWIDGPAVTSSDDRLRLWADRLQGARMSVKQLAYPN
ncbi:aminotransferase class IV [Aestuariimicrobium soli]|uniref:aminotransferase class IV n=1 Tax=Aestuariimicrobium soli TaxID=2035834 RepID=UPI003EB78891